MVPVTWQYRDLIFENIFQYYTLFLKAVIIYYTVIIRAGLKGRGMLWRRHTSFRFHFRCGREHSLVGDKSSVSQGAQAEVRKEMQLPGRLGGSGG